jgi:hypothetical protein
MRKAQVAPPPRPYGPAIAEVGKHAPAGGYAAGATLPVASLYDQLIFGNAEGCDVKLDIPIDYCSWEI